MRLRQLFEAAPAQKVIAVMPGGFHPFHPGHKSLYDWAVETFGKDNVYVAATNDTKSRPFPFDVKIKLAQMAGVPTNRFIQVKSPFNALSYNDIISDASQTALVFVRSEKDKTSHPLPDQVRKSDGNMGYLISYTGDDNLETADTHGYLAYGPTIDFDFSGMSIKSASELRAAWPEMSDEDKLQAAELMYPGNAETATQLLNKALGVTEPAESIEEDISSWVQSLQHTGSNQKSKLPKNKQNAINALGRIQQFEKPADIVQAALNVYGLSPEEVIAALPQDFDPSRKPNHSQATKDRIAAIDRHALEDASEDEEDEFHRKLDKLVHKTFGHSSDEKKKQEDAPPGRERQVKALKKEFPDDEGAPYAIAWAQHNKKKR